MAKLIRHDYSAIHEALNKMIIAEVKAALELLPEKKIKTDGPVPLCRVVVSDADNYAPEDAGVTRIWIDEDGKLYFLGTVDGVSGLFSEDDDLLDISDFGYLIDQIAEQVEGGGTYRLTVAKQVPSAFLGETTFPSIELDMAIKKEVP